MNLRNLAPMIQEQILTGAEGQHTPKLHTEGGLRRICGILDWWEQIRQFERRAAWDREGKASNGLTRGAEMSRCEN
jgi:hypothetical protein